MSGLGVHESPSSKHRLKFPKALLLLHYTGERGGLVRNVEV
jgi:hypothetical protein